MLNKLVLLYARGYDAHQNQAVEAALFDTLPDDTFVLYLWANDNAVIIGKHQNAYIECNLPLLEADGGKLARRITGGGAVYHDKGNVNYTFIAPLEHYYEARQFDMVLRALQSLGIDAVKTGRNDMTVQGRKFSGNAFYKNDRAGLHHGTILIKSDYEKIAKYLTAGKVKLQSKNIASVSQRVINLSEVKPGICKEEVFGALVKTAGETFGLAPAHIAEEDLDAEAVRKRYEFFTDKTRLYGANTFYDARLEHRFDWGTADVRMKVERNTIVKAVVYSDGLDVGLAAIKEASLAGADINDVMEILK